MPVHGFGALEIGIRLMTAATGHTVSPQTGSEGERREISLTHAVTNMAIVPVYQETVQKRAARRRPICAGYPFRASHLNVG